MTKAAKVSTAVVAPEAPAPMTQTVIDMSKQPRTVQLAGMMANVFPQAAALARLGYTFDPAMPQQVFPATGMAAFFMVLGMPDEFAVRGAREAIADAVALEQLEFSKAVQEAAARLIAEQAAAARQLESDAKIAAAEAALAAARQEAKATA